MIAAVIGVGAMGGAMAARLHERGHQTLIRDINPAREAALAQQGLEVVGDAASAAQRADCLFIVVITATQIDEVLSGPSGVLAGIATRHENAAPLQVCLCSTIAPADTEALCRRLIDAGSKALDTPISGGPARARNGTMSMMLAAPEPWLDAAEPILADISATRFRISDKQGDAAKAKLVNNLAAGANLAVAAEAMALAEAVGLNAPQMLDLMAASSGQSWIGTDRMSRAMVDDVQPHAATRVLMKDLSLVAELAQDHRLTLPMAEQALTRFRETCAEGLAEHDDAALLTHYRRLFGRKP